jgi:hypothetical protein
MGTRGFWGFILDGKEYITYNHFDSYPSGLGRDLLTWGESVRYWDAVRDQVRALRLVDEDGTPTEEDRAKHSGSWQNVSTGGDWYALLRGNQGNPGATLDSGVMTDGHDSPLNSLFAEWGYVFDLDAESLDVYAGFQTTLPTEGRWAARPTAAEDVANWRAHLDWCVENSRVPWLPESSKYKAVQRVARWPLTALPTEMEMSALEVQVREEA